MADFQGRNSLANHDLIVVLPKSGNVYNKQGQLKGKYVDLQLDQSLKNPQKVLAGTSKAQTDPHLVHTKRRNPKTNRYFTDHRAYYSLKQLTQMVQAAGTKNVVDQKTGTRALGVHGNLLINARRQVVLNTSAPLKPSRNPRFGQNTLANQQGVTKAAQQRAANLYKQRQAKQAQNGVNKQPTRAASSQAASVNQQMAQVAQMLGGKAPTITKASTKPTAKKQATPDPNLASLADSMPVNGQSSKGDGLEA